MVTESGQLMVCGCARQLNTNFMCIEERYCWRYQGSLTGFLCLVLVHCQA